MTLRGLHRRRGGTPVLVLRALGLGDTLTGLPALRALRRHVSPRPVLLAAPAVYGRWLTDLGVVDDYVVTRDLDGAPPGAALGRHDAVDLHGNGPASRNLLAAGGPGQLLAFAGDAAGRPGPPWRQEEHEVLRWCRLVASVGARPRLQDLYLRPARVSGTHERDGEPALVVVHPGAAFASRRWPAERWAGVVSGLAGPGDGSLRVLLTGSAAEQDLCRGIAVAAGLPQENCLAGSLSLPGLADLVRGADLVVCGDTGVAHLATALRVPSVLLFGPTPPSEWGPIVDPGLHDVLWHGRPGEEPRGDPHGDRPDPALLRITVEEVLAAASTRLHGVQAVRL